VAMRLRLIRGKIQPALTSGALMVAILCAIALSAAPKLHERIHSVTTQHECAVTLFTSGNCEHAACDQVPLEAKPLPPSATFLPPRLSIFIAPVEMSILEHAPPSHS
jgi:hypothetical protein